MVNTGEQEYSSRNAGITTGIVLAVLVPLLLAILCVAYRMLQRRVKLDREDDAFPKLNRSKM